MPLLSAHPPLAEICRCLAHSSAGHRLHAAARERPPGIDRGFTGHQPAGRILVPRDWSRPLCRGPVAVICCERFLPGRERAPIDPIGLYSARPTIDFDACRIEDASVD